MFSSLYVCGYFNVKRTNVSLTIIWRRKVGSPIDTNNAHSNGKGCCREQGYRTKVKVLRSPQRKSQRNGTQNVTPNGKIYKAFHRGNWKGTNVNTLRHFENDQCFAFCPMQFPEIPIYLCLDITHRSETRSVLYEASFKPVLTIREPFLWWDNGEIRVDESFDCWDIRILKHFSFSCQGTKGRGAHLRVIGTKRANHRIVAFDEIRWCLGTYKK